MVSIVTRQMAHARMLAAVRGAIHARRRGRHDLRGGGQRGWPKTWLDVSLGSPSCLALPHKAQAPSQGLQGLQSARSLAPCADWALRAQKRALLRDYSSRGSWITAPRAPPKATGGGLQQVGSLARPLAASEEIYGHQGATSDCLQAPRSARPPRRRRRRRTDPPPAPSHRFP